MANAIPGDINGDGEVDNTDQGLFIEVLLGIDTGDPAHITCSDLNGSGAVNGADTRPFIEAMLD